MVLLSGAFSSFPHLLLCIVCFVLSYSMPVIVLSGFVVFMLFSFLFWGNLVCLCDGSSADVLNRSSNLDFVRCTESASRKDTFVSTLSTSRTSGRVLVRRICIRPSGIITTGTQPPFIKQGFPLWKGKQICGWLATLLLV
jgi:hypothetical protein